MKETLIIDKLILQMVACQDENFNAQYISSEYKGNGNSFIINSDCYLRKLPKYETHYLNSYAVWLEGRHVATISTDCRQFGMSDSIKLSFKNEIFYTEPGWYYYLRKLEKYLSLSFKSVSSLEIAYDKQGINLLSQLCEVYRYSNFLTHNKEIKYAPFDNKLKCSVLAGSTYVFGNGLTGKNATGKQVVVYDKSEEIKVSNKNYITDYYLLNGFDSTTTVERIEAKLAGKWLNKRATEVEQETFEGLKPIYQRKNNRKLEKLLVTPEYLNSQAGLEQLFKAATINVFKFKKITEEKIKDEHRNKVSPTFELINFSDLSGSPIFIKNPSTYNPESENAKRITAKFILHQFAKQGNQQDSDQLLHISQTVKAPKNSDWSILFKRYAEQYDGPLNEQITSRLDSFL